MANLVETQLVGDMDLWLGKGAEREASFAPFCSSYRIFKHTQSNRVAIIAENVDLEKMQAAIDPTERAAMMAAHSVLPPIDLYIELPGQK